MTAEKRGRPKKNVNTFDVNGLVTEYLSTKKDNYDNEISYFKVVDKNIKNKMSGILSQVSDDGLVKMPFWKTEDGEYILKVKSKYTPKKVIVNNDIVTMNLTFQYYCTNKEDDTLLQGYYAKITSYDNGKENNN